MKKKIISILSIILVGIFITGCTIEVGSSRKSSKKNGNIVSDVNESISIEGVSNINIDIAVSQIDIYIVDGNEVKVERTCKGDVYGNLTVEKNNDTIDITEEEVKVDLSKMNINNYLKIGVPKDFNGDFNLKNGVGDCTIGDLNVNDVNIASGVGEMEINNFKCNNFYLEQGVGDSDINLVNSSEVEITGGIGEMDLYMEAVGGNLTYEGGVGDAKIYIPTNSPVRFETTAGIGKCKISAKASGENTYIYDLTTGIGNLEIREK